MNKILCGADPELFAKKNGEFFSAHGLIKGDKKNPYPVKKGAVQVDGMALEFNIHPASTAEEFCINVEDVLAELRAMVPDYEVVAVPVADFTAEHMAAQPAEALELGCDPDFNGWALMPNDKPDGSRLFRTASGHVHIGWTDGEDISPSSEHFNRCGFVAQQMDFFLGLPSLFYDGDVRRREMYGKAGCFRPKSYGCEYRTLSNAWLNSKELMQWVFNNVQAGMENIFKGNLLAEKYGDIQDIINSSDKDKALKIIRAEGIVCPNV